MFDRADVERWQGFQRTLKQRFSAGGPRAVGGVFSLDGAAGISYRLLYGVDLRIFDTEAQATCAKCKLLMRCHISSAERLPV